MIETVLAPIYIYWYAGEKPITSTYIGGSILILTIIGHSIAALRDTHDTKDEKQDNDRVRANNVENTLSVRTDEQVNIDIVTK